MATWKSYRVSDIIAEIESEKFVLPVIQRRLVWDEEKMETLFDTLLKGDSFGGVMVIEEEKDSKPLFNFRPFTKDGSIIQSRKIDKLTQLQNFVIDGQQRLQSFYIGLRGSINGKVLYFDLFSDYKSEYEFKFENNISKLPKQSKDNIDREIPEHNWYLASGLLQRLKDTNDEDQVASEIIKSQKVDIELQKAHIIKNVKAFYKNTLNSEVIGISKVILNKSLDETSNRQRIVELFRRLNDGGTKLSPFDLVASVLKGFAWEMEGFLEDTLKSYTEIGLSQDNLIKLLFLLQDNHKKEMASIDGSDASFAIKNRERIIATLEGLKSFLIESKLYNYYKDSNRSFIPLFFIAYHLYHKQITNEEIKKFFVNYDAGNTEFPKMKKWLYHSLINGVFRSRGAGWTPYKTGIKKILEKIQLFKNLDFPVEILFEVYDNHPIAFTTHYDLANLESLDYAFVFYLIYDRGQTIRIQDVDHILPKSTLENHGVESTKINCIKNYQLLDYSTNRGAKNANPFREWINESVADKQAFVTKHLIPANEAIWDEDNYDAFIAERGNLILNKIDSFIK